MFLSLRLPVVFAMGIALAVFGCKKSSTVTECPQLTRAPQAFLDYWYFPQGSQWIYRLRGATPTVYDTVRVTLASESHITRSQPGDLRAACVQGYQANLTHSNQTYFPGTVTGKLGIEFLSSHPAFYQQDWVLAQTSDIRTLYPLEVGFGHPIRPGEKLLNTLRIVDTMAVVTPAGTFRQSVHLVPDFGSRVDSTQFNWVRHLYRSRRVGITKIVYTNNQTWELVHFTIKP